MTLTLTHGSLVELVVEQLSDKREHQTFWALARRAIREYERNIAADVHYGDHEHYLACSTWLGDFIDEIADEHDFALEDPTYVIENVFDALTGYDFL